MDKRDDKSIFTLSSNKNANKDSIPCRIEFIQQLLNGQQLDPLIEYNKDEEDISEGESFDTRKELGKKTLDFAEIIGNIGGKLDYIKSGTTGHTFHGICGDVDNPTYDYAVKVSAFPKKQKYGNLYDIRRPENAEINMIRELSKLTISRQTPHIALPIGTFDTTIDYFVDLIENDVVNESNKKYNEFVEKYKKGAYYDKVSILISEWANRGDLLDFIKKNHENFSPLHWKVFFFQILSVLAVIQSQYPSFRHNDLKANNILVHKIKRSKTNFTYRIVRSVYKVPNIGYQIKIWDFDFACIPGVVDNQKVKMPWTKAINVTPDPNRYYDVHYFFNTLIRKGFFPQFMTGNHIPQEAKDFLQRIVPKKYQKGGFVHERGRILINHVLTTPDDILKNDPYFAEFRVDENASDVKHRGGKRKEGSRKNRSSRSKKVETESHSNIRRLLEGSNVDESQHISNEVDKLVSNKYKRAKRKSKSKSKSKRHRRSKSKSKDKSKKKIKNKKTSKSSDRKKSKRKNKKVGTVSEMVRELNIDEFLMGSS